MALDRALRVKIIAPASSFEIEPYEQGIKILENQGLEIVDPKPPLRPVELGYLNGSDQERLAELESALTGDYDLVWMARGGYGITRLLGHLKLKKAKKNPLLVGFSDGSALLSHLFTTYGIKGLHGPGVTTLFRESPDALMSLWSAISGKSRDIKYPPLTSVSPLKTKLISGTLIPTNLCLLTHLIGTPSMPQLAGSILILEEVGERPYRLDRMLTHAFSSGVLKGVAAVVIGHLTRCTDETQVDPMTVVAERLKTFGIPMFKNMPMGHETPNWTVPFGVKAELRVSNQQAELVICEEIV